MPVFNFESDSQTRMLTPANTTMAPIGLSQPEGRNDGI